MGKFTDKTYVNTIDSLVDASKSKLENPYYKFTDQRPTKVTYYAQNIEKSTLDEASGLYEAHLGEFSSFKFNKINEFILYGIEKISTDLDVGEFGVESSSISGNAIILPNTIIPRPGDFFVINHLKDNVLFKVNGVTSDTLDTGANFYRIEYALELTNSIDKIEKQLDKNFNFIPTNVGTDFKAIILDTDYELIAELEALVERLIVYFNNIFFDKKLQTFIYNHDGWHMYDPYLIEFLIRNSVLDFGNEYIYVSHATEVEKSFGMDYLRTFFNNLENPKESLDRVRSFASADMIIDSNSLFSCRMDDYYCLRYFDDTPYKTRFTVFDMDVIEHIKENKYFDLGDEKECYNLWVAYFNNDKDFIRGDIVNLIKKIDYMDNLNCFYMLAISIYIIERYIKILLT